MKKLFSLTWSKFVLASYSLLLVHFYRPSLSEPVFDSDTFAFFSKKYRFYSYCWSSFSLKNSMQFSDCSCCLLIVFHKLHNFGIVACFLLRLRIFRTRFVFDSLCGFSSSFCWELSSTCFTSWILLFEHQYKFVFGRGPF